MTTILTFLILYGVPTLVLFLVLLGFWLIAYLFAKLVWAFHPLFAMLNIMVWFLWNPLRQLTRRRRPIWVFLYRLFLFTGLKFAWGAVIYVLTFWPRLALALYYDLLLYWSVSFEHSIRDATSPKAWKYRSVSGRKFWLLWFLHLPLRVVLLVWQNLFTFLDGILMALVSTAFPTYTMYHGTSFQKAAVSIAQKGAWYVGTGDYAGSGLYFGIRRKVAAYYAPKDDEGVIMLVRVTLSPIRNGGTLPQEITRDLGGSWAGGDGPRFSRSLMGLFRTHEHWRGDGDKNWWEYCLLNPEQGRFVRTWRVRPLAVIDPKQGVLQTGGLLRVWKGQHHYSQTLHGWVTGLIALGILYVVVPWMVTVTETVLSK